jgi:hypothetical protein
MSSPIIDLTESAALPPSTQKKRSLPTAVGAKKQTKVAKKDTPHVLLWICAAGKGQSRAWKQKSLKVVGIYKNKAAAEEKREQVIERYGGQCGHGDIVVGDTWEDEIDLVVRPAEEVQL